MGINMSNHTVGVPHCPCCGFELVSEHDVKQYMGLSFIVVEGQIDVRQTSTGKRLPFTPKEAVLLMTLAMLGENGRIASKNMIYDTVYPNESDPDPKIIDVFVCKIRAKLRKMPELKLWVFTHWGQGYALLSCELPVGVAA